MKTRIVYRHGKPGHLIKVAPKRGYTRFVATRYRKERRED